jgi:hypothetical protein
VTSVLVSILADAFIVVKSLSLFRPSRPTHDEARQSDSDNRAGPAARAGGGRGAAAQRLKVFFFLAQVFGNRNEIEEIKALAISSAAFKLCRVNYSNKSSLI